MAEVPLWSPSPERIATSRIMGFIAEVNRRHGLDLKTYRDLHVWSIEQLGAFWSLMWDFGGVIGDKGARLVIDPEMMAGAKFFPDAKLNFAENLLRRADDGAAVVFRGEDKAASEFTWAQLQTLVSRLQQAMKASGVGVGDRVAAMFAGCPAASVAEQRSPWGLLAWTSSGYVG